MAEETGCTKEESTRRQALVRKVRKMIELADSDVTDIWKSLQKAHKGRTITDKDYDVLAKMLQSKKKLPQHRGTGPQPERHGGSVKKYASGGGIRKARYK